MITFAACKKFKNYFNPKYRMVQEITFKNFLSFKGNTTLSFEATRDNTIEDNYVVEVVPGVRLLRFALLYGANASGKSNLLEAFDFLKRFWFDKKDDIDGNTSIVPFLLDSETPTEPSQFEIKFYVGTTKYWYQLKVDGAKVISEKLYFYKTVQPTLLFTRKFEDGQSVITVNPAAVKVSASVVEAITLRCFPNMSFFAARNQVNCSLPIIDDARDWMKNCYMPIIEPETKMFNYANEKMSEDTDLKDYLLSFVHKADFNITGVDSKKVPLPIPDYIKDALLNNEELPISEKEKIKATSYIEKLRTDFVHTVKNIRGEEEYILSSDFQSDGTRRTFGIETAIYEALRRNAFLPIDEIESSLHPDLLELIIEKFLSANSQSQLLVTSHYDPLLTTIDDLIRKDSVWFTEKGDDGASNLYSLIEFKGLNKISSFQKSYRNGIFGAIPNIKS